MLHLTVIEPALVNVSPPFGERTVADGVTLNVAARAGADVRTAPQPVNSTIINIVANTLFPRTFLVTLSFCTQINFPIFYAFLANGYIGALH